jgi:hypothetical protein
MPQAKFSRRSVTTGMVAAVTAIPAVGFSMRANADPRDDKLLALIRRYKAEVAAINASRDLSDEEIDAWTDRADGILAEAVGLPVLTTASAVAVIDLVIEEEDLGSHSIYGAQFLALIHAVRGYIASTTQT